MQSDARFEVEGAGSGIADLLAAVRQFAPDVVLLDAVDRPISRLLPDVADRAGAPVFVVLLQTARRADVLRALQAGVRAVLARDAHPREITAALQAAHDGLAVFSPEI